jgi:hypothetical protein
MVNLFIFILGRPSTPNGIATTHVVALGGLLTVTVRAPGVSEACVLCVNLIVM